MQKTVFATFAESEEQLRLVYLLAESVREFGGMFGDTPIRVYIPAEIASPELSVSDKFKSLDVELRTSGAPKDSLRYYYARKVYAAGAAEAEAEGNADVVVWMDVDTVMLAEPRDFILEDGIGLAYRPVMHNRSGSLYSQPPNQFWSRIYEKSGIADEAIFPMTTPADRVVIRAYFNSGLLVLRPETKILRRWGEYFTSLYSDPVLAVMCDHDIEKRIFIHQTALVGPALNHLSKEQVRELPAGYNYPIFFHRQYESSVVFDSLEGVRTLRYDTYFRNPDPEWRSMLKGPEHLIKWLASRLG